MSRTIALDTARTLAVVKQGLHQRPPAADKETLLAAIRRIGLLQLDTIHVVARSHYLVMLSRVGLYDPADLDALLYPDRLLFEQWAHAACLIPVEDYAHLAPVIHARRERPLYGDWSLKRLGDDPQGVLDAVLDRIREEGALGSQHFEDPRAQRGTWWDWKPAKAALEVLFERGHLMVDRRVNFHRRYDLAERVLPASAAPPRYTIKDWRRWAALRSVSCLGVGTASHVSDYYRQNKPVARSTLDRLAAEGAAVPVEVEGWKETAYLHPDDVPLLDEIEAGAHRPALTTFLSPFDNLTWHRDRLRDLFGLYYRIEMYTPAKQRQYGYYVMPILHQGRMVGRLDPKADRKSGTLIVRAIYLEPGEALTDELVAGIAGALREFMAFHSSQTLVIERAEPAELRAALLA
ncbi:MAG: winged helix DNA-binding domain-containing protein [Chloroflexi bacterium]|nr:winged helix DNA-binding domain-containing protein [Chloroflexota bacterium]MBU1879908.1 winged helix DNA-binding domain-containing protein [Chloroflexota bacterium]